MSLVSLTVESLGQMLGREVPEAHLLIAKNSVLGLDSHGIAEILGVELAEVQEIEDDPEYKEVRLIVASRHNDTSITTDLTWDDIESKALQNIAKRIDFEKDIDTNLKIAAVANRAQRRHTAPTNRILDAGAAGASVKLTLTKRIMERLTSDGGREVETIQQVSIKGGSASNPSFADIDEHLGVSARARTPAGVSARLPSDTLDPASLTRLMDGSRK